jgi:hypothetical protein
VCGVAMLEAGSVYVVWRCGELVLCVCGVAMWGSWFYVCGVAMWGSWFCVWCGDVGKLVLCVWCGDVGSSFCVCGVVWEAGSVCVVW